ncbi:MAG: hypothetical protein ACRDD8_11290 [Bacteroidales bacterium]
MLLNFCNILIIFIVVNWFMFDRCNFFSYIGYTLTICLVMSAAQLLCNFNVARRNLDNCLNDSPLSPTNYFNLKRFFDDDRNYYVLLRMYLRLHEVQDGCQTFRKYIIIEVPDIQAQDCVAKINEFCENSPAELEVELSESDFYLVSATKKSDLVYYMLEMKFWYLQFK